MRTARRSMAVARIAAGFLIVSASIALAADRLPVLHAGGGAVGAGTASATVPSVKIAGHVAGLYPGGVVQVPVRIANPGHIAATVKGVSATVGDAGSGCDSSYLTVKSYRKKLHIAPGGRVKVKLLATMLPTAPDACQGLTFPLVFHAKVRAA